MNQIATNAPRSITEPEMWPIPVKGSLEELLQIMLTFGCPRLSYHKSGVGGWYCALDMNTSSKGSEFTIKSEFGHQTALGAAHECFDRMQSALRGMLPK